MGQTTNAMSWVNAKTEYSEDGQAWTDISGIASTLKIDGGERMVSEFFTQDGDMPILTSGKRSSLTLTVRTVYTEDAADPYGSLLTRYESGLKVYIRWSPAGGNIGDWQFTSGAGFIKTCAYPSGEAESADAIAVEFQIQVTNVVKSTVT